MDFYNFRGIIIHYEPVEIWRKSNFKMHEEISSVLEKHRKICSTANMRGKICFVFYGKKIKKVKKIYFVEII